MEFRTSIEPNLKNIKFGLHTKFLTIGSCFSEVLGNYLNNIKIECLNNPFGVIYNLKSISNLILDSISDSDLDRKKIIKKEELYVHLDYHSNFRNENLENLITQIENAKLIFKNGLKNSNYLVITLGTSWVYEKIDLKEIVSNCHKLDNNLFEKKLLSLGDQFIIFRNLYHRLKEFNPDLKIILTISPVRHLKDTISLNNLSKSILRVLVHDIISQYHDVSYFPAYEIMLDDLRDYRYYKADLIHPNEMAEEYILENFSNSYFNTDLLTFVADWKKIKSAIAHKPFNPKTIQHQIFIKKTIAKIQSLSNKIDVKNELILLKSQLEKEELIVKN